LGINRQLPSVSKYIILRSEIMDLDSIKESVVTNVYHIPSDKKVPLHAHAKQDEIFYCIKGSGFGVLEDSQVEMNVGVSFTVPAGTMHTVRTYGEIYVVSFLIPVVDDRSE
jgi:mannose-6-phosphate isomerase-like protein (cupin superfamily)